MRSYLLLALLSLSMLSACKKDENNYYQFVPPYSINGLADQTMRKLSGNQRASLFSNFYVAFNNGEQERIALSLEGKPAGLYDSLTAKSGYPAFNSMLILADSGVAEGEYTIKMVAQGDKSGRREYPFKLTVTGAPDCTTGLTGNYSKTSYCLGSSTQYTQTIAAAAGVKNRVLFPNLDNNGLQLYADVNCDQGRQLMIPSQTVNGVTYNGSGSVYTTTNGTGATTQVVQLYVISSTSNNGGTSCTYYLSR